MSSQININQIKIYVKFIQHSIECNGSCNAVGCGKMKEVINLIDQLLEKKCIQIDKNTKHHCSQCTEINCSDTHNKISKIIKQLPLENKENLKRKRDEIENEKKT